MPKTTGLKVCKKACREESNMAQKQEITQINTADLKKEVAALKEGGYRLVQISCTHKEGFELTYSFDRDYDFVNLRIQLAEEETLESISSLYFPAFLYENEMKDLFGVKIENIAVDYEGSLYRLSQKTPFNPQNGKGEEK